MAMSASDLIHLKQPNVNCVEQAFIPPMNKGGKDIYLKMVVQVTTEFLNDLLAY